MSIYLPSSLVWLRNTNFQLFVLFDNTVQVLFEKTQCLWNKDTEFLFTPLLLCNNNEFQRNTAPVWRNGCNSSFPAVFFIVYNEANTNFFVVKSTKNVCLNAMMASSGLIHEDKEQTAQHDCYYLQWLNPR